jgi:uncharacterized damage-inducible protein DinB
MLPFRLIGIEGDMKPALYTSAKLSLFIGLLASSVQAAPPAAPGKGPFQRDLLGVYSYTQKQVLDLLEAMPQKKFDWRPAPGVRSVAETYLHIAFANYGMVKMATGKEPPAESGWSMDPAKWDKKTKDKAEIKKVLEDSFAFAHSAIGALPDADLDKKVNFFGNETTVRSVLIILTSHLNEHLGQSVAYARANKITPPWSKGDKDHMPAKKE